MNKNILLKEKIAKLYSEHERNKFRDAYVEPQLQEMPLKKVVMLRKTYIV